MKKLLVVGVIVLFLGLAIAPSTGNRMFNDDITPPVTTCTLDPPEPDGDNGWYVRDIEVTLNATDDLSGVMEIRYRIGLLGSWQKIPGDYVRFVVDDDCNDIPIEFYAIDNTGNEETHQIFTIDMDQICPWTESFLQGFYENNSKWYTILKVDCGDETSGMNRVVFYINDSLVFTDFEKPYEYIIEWSEVPKTPWFEAEAFDNAGNYIHYNRPGRIPSWHVRGFICNPEISDKNITFFAVIVWHIYTDRWFGIPEQGIIMFKRLTFPKEYQRGYIGKYYINANFMSDIG